jgi:hypothetical protein
VADPAYRVELTASFLERLESIEAFLREADAPHAYDALLAALRDTVIPNLRRFPRMDGATWTSRRSPPKRSRNSESCPPVRPTPCGCSAAVTI